MKPEQRTHISAGLDAMRTAARHFHYALIYSEVDTLLHDDIRDMKMRVEDMVEEITADVLRDA